MVSAEMTVSGFPAAVILRPSVMFGPEDDFFNRFAAMTRMGPILPVVGAETRAAHQEAAENGMEFDAFQEHLAAQMNKAEPKRG